MGLSRRRGSCQCAHHGHGGLELMRSGVVNKGVGFGGRVRLHWIW